MMFRLGNKISKRLIKENNIKRKIYDFKIIREEGGGVSDNSNNFDLNKFFL